MATGKGSGTDEDYPRCGATKKQQPFPGAALTCGQAAGWGTTHPGFGRCKLHGGSSPVGGRIQGERLATAAAAATYGLPIVIDAHTALLQEIHRTAGHVAWLAEVVKGIDQNGLVWGLSEDVVGGKNHGKTFKAAPNIWLNLYQTERKHLAAVSSAAIKAGIDERRLELEKSQSTAISTAFFAMLDALNLTDEQRVLALETFPRLLEQIGKGDTDE
jgi:hypothetical protein